MKTLLTVVFLVALTGGSGAADNCVVNDPTGTPLNVRKNPSTSASIVGALKNGITVSAGALRGDWVQVVPQGGKSGWVYRKYLDCSKSAQKNAEPLIVPRAAERASTRDAALIWHCGDKVIVTLSVLDNWETPRNPSLTLEFKYLDLVTPYVHFEREPDGKFYFNGMPCDTDDEFWTKKP